MAWLVWFNMLNISGDQNKTKFNEELAFGEAGTI